MDLGVLLESPQGSESSSPVGVCTCAFLPSCSSSVTLPFPWIIGSVAFPRGFPMRLSHDAFPPGFPTRLSPSDVPRATAVSVDPRFESRGRPTSGSLACGIFVFIHPQVFSGFFRDFFFNTCFLNSMWFHIRMFVNMPPFLLILTSSFTPLLLAMMSAF